MDKYYKTKPTHTRRNVNMKRARIINAIIWSIIAIILCTCVVVEWHQQGCELKSLILAVAMYTSFCGAMGLVIDMTMKER